MSKHELTTASWRKSTRSQQNGACVEIAQARSVVAIRDSKSPDGPVLIHGLDDWRAFVHGLKTGTLD
ncbi:hypothetical protein Sru01_69540 [Sphaerisporangium rufum]|uniref:DUF397 domain-containing protein n=1 Tax=Sphaerisporangium rufum TaxID=1381558 RepID=A0A919V4H7_9ACTN|nr:DUF397 domain-containing protein [Sphaerisporangium rufum]GII81972.1 hypothetical protein Sru01_69540 [Sphaerisporangium rufum]